LSNFNHDEELFLTSCEDAGCEYHSYYPAVGGKCVMKSVVEPVADLCNTYFSKALCYSAGCDYNIAADGIAKCFKKPVEETVHDWC
jgi:hypothetical protein